VETHILIYSFFLFIIFVSLFFCFIKRTNLFSLLLGLELFAFLILFIRIRRNPMYLIFIRLFVSSAIAGLVLLIILTKDFNIVSSSVFFF